MGETEIMKLAYNGSFNTTSKVWKKQLSNDAKDFIEQTLRPDPASRLSVAAALQHPFFAGLKNDGSSTAIGGSPWNNGCRMWQHSWDKLDGLQRLAWLSVAVA